MEYPSLDELSGRTVALFKNNSLTKEEMQLYNIGDLSFSKNDIDDWRGKNEDNCRYLLGHSDLPFKIDNIMKKEHPALVYLILNSRSLADDKEKQSWFDLYSLMNEEQVYKLYDILLREKMKISIIEERNLEAKRRDSNSQ